ncbi:MAG: 7-carboxy-7-deazaguanine synthase QueE [Nitrosomonadales bacterium]|nr:7-carboxy-7-deazaguanine synthase QueE [Nitrosomonadales bacterium]
MLKINEIFYSLQGESSRIGLPTTFIRLTGCPMRCNYCDTAYAFHEGKNLSFDEIIDEIKHFDTNFITVTGGEPLAQRSCYAFLDQLCDIGYDVSLETGGALSIKDVHEKVKIILDIKTPGSGESENNHWDNLLLIKPTDEIKIVITDQNDYKWAKKVIQEKGLYLNSDILFSPSFGDLEPSELAGWILKDNLKVRMQLQLHKIIWGEKKGV